MKGCKARCEGVWAMDDLKGRPEDERGRYVKCEWGINGRYEREGSGRCEEGGNCYICSFLYFTLGDFTFWISLLLSLKTQSNSKG